MFNTHDASDFDASGGSGYTHGDTPVEIELYVASIHRKLPHRVRFHVSSLIVGRHDDAFQVDVDLTLYRARENGVSRRHAALIRNDEGIFLQDLNSTNGTRINGYKLNPQQAYRLRNGDELEFGYLRAIVHFTPPEA